MKRTRIHVFTGLVVLAVMALPVAQVGAEETDPLLECYRPADLDKYKLLRRLSLDLRHRLPDHAEYEALHILDGVPESVIDGYLTSDDFRVVARRFHERLLWPNLKKVELTAFSFRVAAGQNGVVSLVSSVRRNTLRKSQSATCLPIPQPEDAYYVIEDPFSDTEWRVPMPLNDCDPLADPGCTRQEGWVEVPAYWVPEGGVARVCAYDAQDASEVPAMLTIQDGKFVPKVQGGQVVTVDCDAPDNQAMKNPLCGCGPDLRRCWAEGAEQALWSAMREQLLLLVDRYTVGDKRGSYGQLLVTPETFMNSTIQYWKTYLAPFSSFQKTFNVHASGDVPTAEDDATLHFAEDRECDTAVCYMEDFELALRNDGGTQAGLETWRHSGILTLPAYSLRFQTNRARANRFRTVFTRQYFVPPADPEDETSADCDPDSDDLTQRCTCRYCHQVLEPMAAYWGGTVAEAGSGLISDRAVYGEFDQVCHDTAQISCVQNQDCGTSEAICRFGRCIIGDCLRFYDEAGVLLPYSYVQGDGLDALHEKIRANLDTGPAGFAAEILDNGQFHSSMVQNLYDVFMGREMNLDPADPANEIDALSGYAGDFQADDDFVGMVRRLVTSPAYQRSR